MRPPPPSRSASSTSRLLSRRTSPGGITSCSGSSRSRSCRCSTRWPCRSAWDWSSSRSTSVRAGTARGSSRSGLLVVLGAIALLKGLDFEEAALSWAAAGLLWWGRGSLLRPPPAARVGVADAGRARRRRGRVGQSARLEHGVARAPRRARVGCRWPSGWPASPRILGLTYLLFRPLGPPRELPGSQRAPRPRALWSARTATTRLRSSSSARTRTTTSTATDSAFLGYGVANGVHADRRRPGRAAICAPAARARRLRVRRGARAACRRARGEPRPLARLPPGRPPLALPRATRRSSTRRSFSLEGRCDPEGAAVGQPRRDRRVHRRGCSTTNASTRRRSTSWSSVSARWRERRAGARLHDGDGLAPRRAPRGQRDRRRPGRRQPDPCVHPLRPQLRQVGDVAVVHAARPRHARTG